MMQYLVLSFLLVQGVLVCVIICYARANSVMFIGSSDRCGCQVCGDGACAEMMVAERDGFHICGNGWRWV